MLQSTSFGITLRFTLCTKQRYNEWNRIETLRPMLKISKWFSRNTVYIPISSIWQFSSIYRWSALIFISLIRKTVKWFLAAVMPFNSSASILHPPTVASQAFLNKEPRPHKCLHWPQPTKEAQLSIHFLTFLKKV